MKKRRMAENVNLYVDHKNRDTYLFAAFLLPRSSYSINTKDILFLLSSAILKTYEECTYENVKCVNNWSRVNKYVHKLCYSEALERKILFKLNCIKPFALLGDIDSTFSYLSAFFRYRSLIYKERFFEHLRLMVKIIKHSCCVRTMFVFLIHIQQISQSEIEERLVDYKKKADDNKTKQDVLFAMAMWTNCKNISFLDEHILNHILLSLPLYIKFLEQKTVPRMRHFENLGKKDSET